MQFLLSIILPLQVTKVVCEFGVRFSESLDVAFQVSDRDLEFLLLIFCSSNLFRRLGNLGCCDFKLVLHSIQFRLQRLALFLMLSRVGLQL